MSQKPPFQKNIQSGLTNRRKCGIVSIRKSERRDANENSIVCRRKSDRYGIEIRPDSGVDRGASDSGFYRVTGLRNHGGIKMERKENTPVRESRRRYEEKNKEQRKQKSGNFGTMIPRELFEEINAFLKKYGYTKVQLIEAGYKALQEDAAEHDLALGKIADGYDDFFSSELEEFEKRKKDN